MPPLARNAASGAPNAMLELRSVGAARRVHPLRAAKLQLPFATVGVTVRKILEDQTGHHDDGDAK